MKIDNVEIIANSKGKDSKSIVNELTKFLEEYNINYLVHYTHEFTQEVVLQTGIDLLITIGGDGTVLYSAQLAERYGCPILAINLGTFGYITEISHDEWKDALLQLINGKGNLSSRLLLNTMVVRDGEVVYSRSSLNEAVITSSGVSRIVYLDFFIDDTRAGAFKSDGVIIATPTGSTAYSLASGGPILYNDMKAFVITPVCPFTLSDRPIVLGLDHTVRIIVKSGQRTEVMLCIDGQSTFKLEESDEIIVGRSPSNIQLVSSDLRNYTQIIKNKLKWSGGLDT